MLPAPDPSSAEQRITIDTLPVRENRRCWPRRRARRARALLRRAGGSSRKRSPARDAIGADHSRRSDWRRDAGVVNFGQQRQPLSPSSATLAKACAVWTRPAARCSIAVCRASAERQIGCGSRRIRQGQRRGAAPAVGVGVLRLSAPRCRVLWRLQHGGNRGYASYKMLGSITRRSSARTATRGSDDGPEARQRGRGRRRRACGGEGACRGGLSVVLFGAAIKWLEQHGHDEFHQPAHDGAGNAFGPDDERYRRVIAAGPGKWRVAAGEGGDGNVAACVGSGMVSYGAMAWPRRRISNALHLRRLKARCWRTG